MEICNQVSCKEKQRERERDREIKGENKRRIRKKER